MKQGLAWAAGFLEARNPLTSSSGRPRLQVTHRNPRLLERLRDELGVGRVYGPYSQPPRWMWVADKTLAEETLARLKPYLTSSAQVLGEQP